MAQHEINGIRTEVETRGSEEAPAFLLIRGLSSQLIHWPEVFLARFVEAGFRVVVFDNRDVGKSTKFSAAGIPSMPITLAGEIEAPYSVADMAAVFTDTTRADRLAEIEIPFFVLHGSADPLIPPACVADTAKRVRAARFEVIEGMGHDITVANSLIVAAALIGFARRA